MDRESAVGAPVQIRLWRAAVRREGGKHEKFFYCQKSRLRVHAACFYPAGTEYADIEREFSIECTSNEKNWGTGASCKPAVGVI
jgi:hypothetical protein